MLRRWEQLVFLELCNEFVYMLRSASRCWTLFTISMSFARFTAELAAKKDVSAGIGGWKSTLGGSDPLAALTCVKFADGFDWQLEVKVGRIVLCKAGQRFQALKSCSRTGIFPKMT